MSANEARTPNAQQPSRPSVTPSDPPPTQQPFCDSLFTEVKSPEVPLPGVDPELEHLQRSIRIPGTRARATPSFAPGDTVLTNNPIRSSRCQATSPACNSDAAAQPSNVRGSVIEEVFEWQNCGYEGHARMD